MTNAAGFRSPLRSSAPSAVNSQFSSMRWGERSRNSERVAVLPDIYTTRGRRTPPSHHRFRHTSQQVERLIGEPFPVVGHLEQTPALGFVLVLEGEPHTRCSRHHGYRAGFYPPRRPRRSVSSTKSLERHAQDIGRHRAYLQRILSRATFAFRNALLRAIRHATPAPRHRTNA